MKNMSTKERIKKAEKHLKRIYQIMSQRKSPFEGMTKDEAIEKIRKVREELWEEKIATRARFK